MPTSAGDIIRIACRQLYDGTDDVVNVFHAALPVVPTPNTNAALLADVAAWIGDVYLTIQSHLCNNLTADVITVFNVTDDAPIGVTSFGSGYTGGTASGECMPTPNAMLIILPTSVKRTQGRIYLAPFQEGDHVDGRWSGSLLVDGANFADALLAPGASPNGTEFAYGILKRSDGLLYQPQTVRVQPIVAYQLRRKPGRGS